MLAPSLLLTTALVAATTASARVCKNITVPVSISARTGVFGNIAVPQTNLDATVFIQNLTRQGGNFTNEGLTGYATTSGNYSISATFCRPGNGTGGDVLQILTHGIGFDKSYWDLSYDNYNYSYVDNALAAGYSTLSYDRLGIGNSTHAHGALGVRDEIQSFLEIAALAEMTTKLRNGTFPNVKKRFSKIVHVGHSFGSAQSYALTAMYPGISDGLVLTGFSMNGSFVAYFAAGADFQQAYINQPLRFGSPTVASAISTVLSTYSLSDLLAPIDLSTLHPLDYPAGYLANRDANTQQYLFLLPNRFDPGLLAAGEASKQPVTIGELLTLGSIPASSTFKGPVLVFTGSGDLPYCGGDCLATGGVGASIPAAVGKAFPDAESYETYIQPATGHGLNFHYNATAGYSVIQNWLAAHDL